MCDEYLCGGVFEFVDPDEPHNRAVIERLKAILEPDTA